MRPAGPDLTVLENTHAITIMLILAREGSMYKGMLYQKISKNTASVQRRIDSLVMAGLVTETETKEHPFPRIIDLTPLGREVAEHLQAIEELMRRE
jgi:DNA-binding HxlR family transcriptional regulator